MWRLLYLDVQWSHPSLAACGYSSLVCASLSVQLHCTWLDITSVCDSTSNWWCHQQTINMLGKTVNIKKAWFNLISDSKWLKHRIQCRILLSRLINMVMSSRALSCAMITEMYLWVYLYVGCWLAIFQLTIRLMMWGLLQWCSNKSPEEMRWTTQPVDAKI